MRMVFQPYHNRPEVLKAARDSGLRAVEARGNRL